MSGTNKHIVIVGTGFAGLAMAIRLKKASNDDFTLLESSNEVGGTWRDNTYPGARCDVPSAVYSFSFEPNPRWSSKFSPQQEIFSYLKHCADKFKIRPHIRFQSQVEGSEFDEATGLWTVRIEGQPSIVCRYLILGTGGLSRPAYPKIPGLESFKGELFHSARWNHDFPLKGARVGLIGTGASAIQIVPAIADQVGRLSLFQRTPAWILPKADRSYSALERNFLTKIPGFQYLRRKLLYWQFELRAIGLLKPFLMRFPTKEAIAFIEKEIDDPALRAKLTPQYTMGCKRILLSNEFYPTLNKDHVELFDQGIERVTAKGIVTKDGREHELDALICATGFQVAEASAPFPIKGKNGLVLSEVWADGAEAYLGTSVSGFPNLFTIVGPNTGLGHNSIVFMIESHAQYIGDAIKKLNKGNYKFADVKLESQRSYNETLAKRFKGTVWSEGGCVSWYHNAAGRNTTLFPGFSFQLRQLTRAFHTEAYHLEPLNSAAAKISGPLDGVKSLEGRKVG